MESSSSSNQEASAPWRPRKYVLLGMGVFLGASALTIVTSIILQPADISFSATAFSLADDDLPQVEAKYNAVLYFNLTSHNPGRRAGLEYRYISVSMQLQHNGNPSVRKTSVPATVNTEDWKVCQHQKTNSSNTMRVKALLDKDFYNFYGGNASATVMVFAQARFKVGQARSRFYNIRVRCKGVELPSVGSQQSRTVDCYE